MVCRMAVITVGVDGSEGGAAALRWAAAEARLRGAKLRVVHAWNVPTIAYAGSGFLPSTSFEDDIGKAAQEGLSQWLETAKGDLEGLDVEHRVVEGHSAAVLVEAAADAELIVVGSRGLGGFSELLLGSVSHQVAQRAHCPVVIIRG
jgi:nucleotide-binding universal stress UspA family protein